MTANTESPILLPGNQSHLDALVDIEQQVNPAPWGVRQFRASLDAHSVVVACDRSRVAGFVIWNSVLDEAELLNVAVAPGWQGRGLGGRLLDHCLAQSSGAAARVFLEVRASNSDAIALYTGRGFARIGVRKSYYPRPEGREDAWVMQYDHQ